MKIYRIKIFINNQIKIIINILTNNKKYYQRYNQKYLNFYEKVKFNINQSKKSEFLMLIL